MFVHIAKANTKKYKKQNEPARLERNFYDPQPNGSPMSFALVRSN